MTSRNIGEKIRALLGRLRVGLPGRLATIRLIAALILVASIIGIALVAPRPNTRYSEDKLYDYTHVASYRYLAEARPSTVYNSTIIGMDEPLYLKLIDGMNITLEYTVKGAVLKRGSIRTVVRVVSPSGWEKTLYSVSDELGGEYSKTFTIDVGEIEGIIDKIRSETGLTSSRYEIRFETSVEAYIDTESSTIQDRFNPVYTVSIDYGDLKIHTDKNVKTDHREDYVKTYTANHVEILGFTPTLMEAKTFLYLLSPVSSIVFIVSIIAGRKPRNETEVFESKYSDIIVDADPPGDLRKIVVKNAEDLGRIALNLNKPILRDSQKAYHVVDGSVEYTYTGGTHATRSPG